MKIGIRSDTHDNFPLVEKAIEVFKSEGVKTVIHAGDLCASVTLKSMLKVFKVYFCLGNNDRDIIPIRDNLKKNGGVFLGFGGDFVLGGKKFAVFHGHYPFILNALIESQEYDYIITGHTHEPRDEVIGRTHVINPGSLYPTHYNGIAILDTSTDNVKMIKFGDKND